MNELRWADNALGDLDSISDFYDRIDPELSLQMVRRIERATRSLLLHPKLGAPIGFGRLRKWQVRRTSYLPFYRETSIGIEVARVVHAAQDWRRVLG